MTKKSTYEELEHRPKEVATETVERNRRERAQGKTEDAFLAKKSVAFIAGILILFGLYLSSLYSYLLFHSLAEIFSIVVACGIFIVAWNSRRIMDNNYLLFLGIAYLFIGVLDLVHTLGYRGMGIFHGYATNLPTQLWIAARYMESLSLLIAPLFLARRLKANLVLMAYASATLLVLGSVFYWHIFPTCFVEGIGLTPFKKISEYIISIILLGAITLLFQKRKEFDERVFRLLVAAMGITIAAELAFTFYIHAYGFSNLVGHYFKIISFYLIYKAIIETGLTRPYTLLFRNLKQSEESLRLQAEITSHLSEGVYLIRVSDGVILYTNPKFEEIFGYGPGEMVGKHGSIVNAPTEITPEERVDHIAGIVKKTGSWRGEIQNIKKDGTSFWCYASASIFDHPEYGEIIISVHADITERKKIEKELQEVQRELDIIFNSVPALIWSKNNEGKYLQVNRTYCETVGLPKEKILGRTDYDLYPTDIADQYSKYDQEIIDSKKPVLGIEEHHLKPSGDYGWSLTQKLPYYYDAEGNNVGTIGFAIDITDRKVAEEALRESEAKYRRLSENSPAVIYQFMMTPEGAFTFPYVSRVVAVIMGISAEDAMKDSSQLLDMVHPEDQEMLREGIMKSAESLESFPLTFRCLKDGEVIWIEARGTPEPLADGGILWDGFFLDISKRKQMEEELLKVKKFKSLGVLAGGIAHQFNNALSSITGHTGLLEMEYILKMRR
ncbi:MAG: PAS domain S-box protein [Desulfobacteraceae bacterium]|nr:PAS domain S-box protein [Desulfobacteraceae bacterium]